MKLVASLGITLLLVSCQSPFNGKDDAWSPQGNHPITVDQTVISENFAVAADASLLTQDDRDRLAGLIDDYKSHGLGKLAITSPQGSANALAAVQMAAQMTEVARARGISGRFVDVAGYQASAQSDIPPVIVSYTVYAATASECGTWTRNYAFAPLNHQTPDHGCATQHNLAAMIENPRDLVMPRNVEAADQGRRQVTLDKYRKGDVTAADKTTDDSGAVSEVNE